MSAQVKFDQQEPGNSGAAGRDQGDGRGVAQQGRDVLVAQPASLFVDPGHGLGMHPGSQFQGRRAIGRRAVSRRIDRAGVRDVGRQLGRADQPLPPVGEQVGVRADDDRQVRWNLVDHRDGAVEMAKAMAGDVKGELRRRERASGVGVAHDFNILAPVRHPRELRRSVHQPGRSQGRRA